MSEAGKQTGRLKISEKHPSQLIHDKKAINGYKKYKLELTPEKLDLHLSKSMEAKILEFRLVGLCYSQYAQDDDSIKDEDLKKLAIVMNSANKVHTLNLDFDRYKSETYVGFDAICQSLRKMTSLKSLGFSFWREITNERMSMLCKALKNLSSLKSISINFRSCENVTDVGLCKLSQTLRTLSSLRKIEIIFDECYDIQGNGVIWGLSKALKKLRLLKNLTLRLEGCGQIQDSGLQSFGQELGKLGSLQALDLDFRGGVIKKKKQECTDTGFESLFQGIKSLVSLRKMHLDFHGSDKITEKSVYSFGQALEALSSLQSIHLASWNSPKLDDVVLSQIGRSLEKLLSLKNVNLDLKSSNVAEKGMSSVGQSLKSLPDLEQLTLNFGESMTDSVMSALGRELKSVQHLQGLDIKFDGSQITDEGIEGISMILEELPLLKRLGLGFSGCNRISVTGLRHLCQRIKKLVSLQDLDLDLGYDVEIANARMKLVGEVLKALKPLKNFSFNLTGVNEETDDIGLKNLCQGLKTHTSLQSLNLIFTYYNEISDKELKMLAKTLMTFTSLKQISLDFTGTYQGLGERELTALAKAFKRLTRLEKISLGILCPGTSVENFTQFVEAFKTMRYLESLILGYYVNDWSEEIENGFKTLKNLPSMKKFEFNDECP